MTITDIFLTAVVLLPAFDCCMERSGFAFANQVSEFIVKGAALPLSLDRLQTRTQVVRVHQTEKWESLLQLTSQLL